MKNRIILSTLLLAFSFTGLLARENANTSGKKANSQKRAAAALCAPARTQTDLNINNIRTTILAGGDMWWDLNTAQFEVPKGTGLNSMFSGSLWIGGVDDANQLKLAAMTYRQSGNDFWPGPLTTDGTASIEDDVCSLYDQHWLITREMVDIHVGWLNCKNDPSCNENEDYPGYANNIPEVIVNWPAFGAEGELNRVLGPFEDVDQDGAYDPEVDYPRYDLTGEGDCKGDDYLFGDQTIFWVYNDRGNVHTESGAQQIGLEIQAQAFSFATNDEINNMTFNNYKIINRSTFGMDSTWFGTWFDPDLGRPDDDVIGCDIPRGLGYCYNGDADDDGPLGYGLNPPAVGFDFFQGPVADPNDGIDNDRDSLVDEPGELIIMSNFMYYNNSNSNVNTTNPSSESHYYQYLQSRWKNNNPLTYGGTGFEQNPTTSLITPYAYPDVTVDFRRPGFGGPGNPWREDPSNQADKRGLHGAGPFSLAPGATNSITSGIIWARDNLSGDPFESVELVRLADDKAQILFDNCFQVLNGPDAPDMTIQELDKTLIITLTNKETSNNYNLTYRETDPLITAVDPSDDEFVFEGYQIFQFKDATVSVTDLYDASRSRLVAQADVKNGVTTLINYLTNDDGLLEPNNMTLKAEDAGVKSSFIITEDAFATGDLRLINHKKYYFTVIAYGYNNFAPYNAATPDITQKEPYKAGRRNIQTYVAIPHITSSENGGTVIQANYGDGVKLTRIEGQGNGGNELSYTSATESFIVNNFKMDNPTYDNGAGPIDIRVIDPLNVPVGNYTFTLDDNTENANWEIADESGTVIATSNSSLVLQNEQIIPELGLSVTIGGKQNYDTGLDTADIPNGTNNGFISASMEFDDPTKAWLTGLPDADIFTNQNWIRSGNACRGNVCQNPPESNYPDMPGVDPREDFEEVLGGTWSPYALAAAESLNATNGTAGGGPANPRGRTAQLTNLQSVDVVFTSDQSLWTRVPVFEMGEEASLNEGGVSKWTLRAHASVDKNGNDDGTGTGWGWFPGYAVDLETGTRLNMAIGEDSWLVAANGNDMKWNPTTVNVDFFGGKHYIYIMRPFYDVNGDGIISGTADRDLSYRGDDQTQNPYFNEFNNLNPLNAANALRNFMWVNIPLIAPGRELLETDVRVKLRVLKPYAKQVVDNSNNGFNKYSFNTSDVATRTGNTAAAKNALDIIKVVPNPYYAYSLYEESQIDTRVKITNVPERCVISIFTSNGTLIRTFDKDNSDTFVEWDLKNNFNIPIASGVYIIHVKAEGIGEKVVKWFGTMRPVDVQGF